MLPCESTLLHINMSKELTMQMVFNSANALLATAIIAIQSVAATTEDPATIHPLFEGLSVPEGIHVISAQNEKVDLSEKLKEAPSILVFYRGGWCPYCNKHLSEIAEIEPTLVKIGYSVIALSADSADSLHDFLGENPFSYELFSDANREASDAFGLTFRVDDETYEKYKNWGLDLEAASGNESHELPVPGVFVIKDGVIQFAYVNPDYSIRLHGDVLLTAAKAAMKE